MNCWFKTTTHQLWLAVVEPMRKLALTQCCRRLTVFSLHVNSIRRKGNISSAQVLDIQEYPRFFPYTKVLLEELYAQGKRR
jgi:hypothetical protein